MTLSQSSSSSSLYASPVGRFSSTGFGMYDIEEGSRSRSRSGGWGGIRREKDPRKHEEELINAYEAEEERIINVLSKKLEQLREDKIELENALEAESESHVNRLSRELGALRKANRELEERLGEKERLDREGDRSSGSSKGKGKGKRGSGSSSSEQDGKTKVKKSNGSTNGKSRTLHSGKRPSNGMSRVASSSRTATTTTTAGLDETTMVALTPIITSSTVASPSPTPLTVSTRNLDQYQQQHHTQDDISNPSATLVMDALRRENEQLRTKLVDMEREFGRVKRLNEVYREELISLRGKLGQPVDHLIGLTPSERDPFEYPTHVRSSRTGKEREKDPPSPLGAPAGMNGGQSSSSTSMAMSYKPRFVRDAGGHSAYYQQQPVLSNGHTYGHAQIYTTSPAAGTSSMGMGMPIPRPPSQIRHRPLDMMNEDMDGPFLGVDVDEDYLDEEDLSRSPTSSRRPAGASHGGAGRNSGDTILSPTPSTPSSVSSASLLYPFSDSSPVNSSVLRSGAHPPHGAGGSKNGEPASYVSVETDVTSLPSSGSLGMMMGMHQAHAMNANGGGGVGMGGMVMGGIGLGAYGVPQRGLSYPSVPPPSLSSSFGSPSVSAFAFGGAGGGNERGESISPIESRRGSLAGLAAASSRRGSMNDPGGSSSGLGNAGGRRVVESGSLRSVPVGARVAEMGTLSGGRSRAGSMNPNLSPSSSSILREALDEDADS